MIISSNSLSVSLTLAGNRGTGKDAYATWDCLMFTIAWN